MCVLLSVFPSHPLLDMVRGESLNYVSISPAVKADVAKGSCIELDFHQNRCLLLVSILGFFICAVGCAKDLIFSRMRKEL